MLFRSFCAVTFPGLRGAGSTGVRRGRPWGPGGGLCGVCTRPGTGVRPSGIALACFSALAGSGFGGLTGAPVRLPLSPGVRPLVRFPTCGLGLRPFTSLSPGACPLVRFPTCGLGLRPFASLSPGTCSLVRFPACGLSLRPLASRTLSHPVGVPGQGLPAVLHHFGVHQRLGAHHVGPGHLGLRAHNVHRRPRLLDEARTLVLLRLSLRVGSLRTGADRFLRRRHLALESVGLGRDGGQLGFDGCPALLHGRLRQGDARLGLVQYGIEGPLRLRQLPSRTLGGLTGFLAYRLGVIPGFL